MYNINNKSSFTTNNNNCNIIKYMYHYLQDYLNNFISRICLKDDIKDLKLNFIVVI
jgi:hypothetical protein